MEPEQNVETDIQALADELPAPVRDFIARGEARASAKRIMGKYQLHVDQAGVVERELLLLLVGLADPSAFTSALVAEAGLDQQTIAAIVQDINREIFVPLREEMRRAGAQPAAPAGARTGPPASVPPRASVPPPRYAPPAPRSMQAPATPLPPSAPSPHVAPLPPKVAMPGFAPRVAAPPVPPPLEKLLEDHEEPHIEFHSVPPPPTPRAIPSVPANLPGASSSAFSPHIDYPPTPPRMAPPPPLPAVPPPHPAPPPAPTPLPVTPPLGKPDVHPQQGSRTYLDDPYREPIEE